MVILQKDNKIIKINKIGRPEIKIIYYGWRRVHME